MKTLEPYHQRIKAVILKIANTAKIAHFMHDLCVSEDAKDYFSIHESNLAATKALLFKGIGTSTKEIELLYGKQWIPVFVYLQIRFWKYNDLEMIDLLKKHVDKIYKEVEELITALPSGEGKSILHEALDHLDILLSALNIQRFYAAGILPETN